MEAASSSRATPPAGFVRGVPLGKAVGEEARRGEGGGRRHVRVGYGFGDRDAADRVKTLPKAGKVVQVQNGKVSVSVLLGLGAAAEADLESRPSHHDLEGEHDHEDFDTFVVDVPSFASPQELVDRIAKATGTHDILRVKGFVEIAGKPMRLLVQGVGARIQHQFDRAWRSGENRQGRLVVIGEKGFDKEAIRTAIAG